VSASARTPWGAAFDQGRFDHGRLNVCIFSVSGKSIFILPVPL
jgi:hypothetical protein